MRAWGILPALLVLACGGPQGDADDAGVDGEASVNGGPDGGSDTAGGSDGGTAPLDATGPDASGAPVQGATTFLENAGHTSAIADAGVTPPLRRAWTATFPGAVSYPLVANGLVFLTTNATSSSLTDASTRAQLVAIDAATGKTAWSADIGTASSATAAYDQGRVFSMDQSTSAPVLLRAFDAATGKLAWTANPQYQNTFEAPPVAYRGIVYLLGFGEGGTVYAYDESTGTLLWNALVSGGEGAPAVSDDGVFVSDGCESVVAFDRTTGAKLWETPSSCDGSGDTTPVVSGTTVYAIDTISGNLKLNAKTGAKLGSFIGDLPPAFDGSLGFVVSNGTLVAATGGLASTAWTFVGDGRLGTAPFVTGGTVYVGSSEGNFYAVDEASGAAIWSENLGYPLTTKELLDREPRVAIAGAGGVVLVPAGSTLVAYESGGAADAGTHEGGADGGCTYALTPMLPVPTGEFPQALAIADLNGDGHPDFSVVYDDDLAPPPDCYVMAIPGRGDGTFGAAGPPYLVGGGASAVAAGDFNRDGAIDLAVANTYDTPFSVGVLLGNGDGTLRPQVTYATGSDPMGVAVGDFDKNGTLDVAVATSGLDILLGNGDGTFAPEVAYPSNSYASYGVAVGDIDGDGVLDAVIVHTYGETVGVFRGKGDGTFQPETQYATGTEPSSVALGDVDGDGHLDVAVTNYRDDTVGVLYGQGDGTFAPQVAYPAGLNPNGVVIVDLNRDGLADLAATNFDEATVSVLLNAGSRQFANQFVMGTGAGPSALATADLNADGWPDLAAVDADDNTVAVFLGGCTSP
jgi:outer membrane protein assembly factor BamB